MSTSPEEPGIQRYPIGESCVCWSLGNAVSHPALTLSRRVLAAYKAVKQLQAGDMSGILDVVPSYVALAVYFDPLAENPARLEQAVETAIRSAVRQPPPDVHGREITLPVRYDGPDLDRVSGHTGLSQDKVISLHAAARYTVAMIGFMPHFPYLTGLPESLSTPRLDSPRRQVPAGSVTITGVQTGIYPTESSGGWNIIGHTDPCLLEPIEPGDTVIFQPQ